MKSKISHLVTALVCGVILVSCGGGSEGSKIKKNEYFGMLPSIYASYKASKDAIETESDKVAEKIKETDDLEKVFKLAAELQEKEEAMEEKMETAAIAEIQSLVGRDIPVSYSTSLQSSDELFYNVSAKLAANEGSHLIKIELSYTAKTNLDVPGRNMRKIDGKYWAYYRLVSTSGSTIRTGFSSDLVKQDSHPVSISAGTALLKSDWNSSCDLTYMIHEPEKYANFAGIEFITKAEYDAIPGE